MYLFEMFSSKISNKLLSWTTITTNDPLLGHFHHLKIFCAHWQQIPVPTFRPRQQLIYSVSTDLPITDIIKMES